MTDDVAVLGVGMHPWGKWGKNFVEYGVKAANDALADAATDASELHVLDAGDITGADIARIALPQRVPYGFHGNWVPDSSVAPPT